MSRIYYGSKNFVLDSLKSEYKNKEIIQIYEIEKQIVNINKFFDNDKIFLYINPNNTDIKLIESQIDKNIGLNYIYYENENFDGRISLIQKIKKNNNIFNMCYPILGDFLSFKRHLISYLKNKNVNIKSDCLDWLKDNSPIFRLKSKTSKKEELFYDLDLLFKEIDKIASVKNEISIEDFDNSLFKKDDDIFLFIDYLLEGNLEKSIELYDHLKKSTGEQAVLMILIYQMIFLINLLGAKNKIKYDIDKVIEYIELKDILGIYRNENWEQPVYSVKSQNPVRVKIAYSKYNYNLNKITKIFQILVETTINTRNISENPIAGFLMINKVCNV